MNIELIRKHLSDVEELIKDWSGEVAAIERDMALDKIKMLYEEVRFSNPMVEAAEPSDEPNEPEVEVEIAYYEGEDEDEEYEGESEVESESEESDVELQSIDMEIISLDFEDVSLINEDNEEVEMEVEDNQTSAPEQQYMEQPQPTEQREVESTKKPMPTECSLFDLDTIPIKTKSRRSAILSLYSDGVSQSTLQSATSPKEEEDFVMELIEIVEIPEEEIETNEVAANEERAAEMPTMQTFGESFDPPAPTIADMFEAEQNTMGSAVSQPCSSINDQYIIAQDLFGGDIEACEDMLARLEMMDNFEDSMIYIAENFSWDPDSEGAKLVIKLLEAKYPLE